ncbi:TIR domain protein [Helicobacter pylori]|uniref:toll/interleukin-1 receptor domain-containing protein n=1 Tax=Helicobacter pylori TaxID=210 RepID=UPI000EB18663|nr:toll/interleukin-1 receptor domain-containing protein [Helicobacter pylori]RKV20015.1 TIR domain protein [Helicobacter pylori]
MSENIKKTTKAFRVDLDSSENQSILKPSTRCSNNQAHQVNEAAEKIHELIENAPYSNDNIVLKRNEIKEAFFSPFKPQLKNAQVFLSHSHADINKALEVKGYLESKTNHKVFVDSLFWDYKDDVLNKLAEYAEYDDNDISVIEDAFTLILRESLEDMIKKCPYFVFLQSKNSVSLNQGLSQITYSAWIYEELRIAHSISSKSRLTIMMESFQVSHDISPFLEHLETITLRKLSHIINS